jgi:hypothetical protein
MGSTGGGRIRDYPGSSKPPSDDSGGGGGGTPPPSDRCARAISVALEDIEHCDYFGTHGVVPPVGEILKVAQRKRVVAETAAGVSVGNLPTSYNYLAACLKDGWTYVGSIRSSSNGPPLAAVTADFGAVAPP